MHQYSIHPIGYVKKEDGLVSLQILPDYRPGLTNLQGYSHLWILWWAHHIDLKQRGKPLIMQQLFKRAPHDTGIFSTRSPHRPNPIMISTITVISLDTDHGTIQTPFIDAEDGTPVLDIKPYFPMDRVEQCQTPAWCRH